MYNPRGVLGVPANASPEEVCHPTAGPDTRIATLTEDTEHTKGTNNFPAD